MRSVTFATGIGIFLLLSIVIAAKAQSPLGPHCIGAGPLALNEPDFCGCTWGEIYFEGEALEDVEVVLAFGDQFTTTHTVKEYDDEAAFFSISGAGLGAKRGDILTVTVTVGEQSLSRVFRALPDADGEQHVPIVVPSTRTVESLNLSGYSAAVAVDDEDVLWSGGEAGLLSLNLTTNQTKTYTLPTQIQTVQDIEIDPSGVVWVLGEAELAVLDGTDWLTYTVPITGTLYDIAIDKQSSDIWVGGGQNGMGTIARFSSGIWQEAETFPAAVRTIAFGDQNEVWIGTWSKGVYRQDNNDDWTQYTTADGLASDYVYDIESNESTMWFGTRPYLGADGYFGGLSQYDTATGVWQTFTPQNGLPIDTTAPDLGDESDPTDNIYALAADPNGLVWIGSTTGAYREIQPGLWTAVSGSSMNGPVSDIDLANGHLVVASSDDVSLLLPSSSAFVTSTVASVIVNDGPEIAVNGTLIAQATVDEVSANDGTIVGWEWSSDLDGPLCTTADICEYDASKLTIGTHSLRVRVQNEMGVWSPILSEPINVVENKMQHTNLPIVIQDLTTTGLLHQKLAQD